jgi:hypothetical protein
MIVGGDGGIQSGGQVEILAIFANEQAPVQIAVDIGVGYRRVIGVVVVIIIRGFVGITSASTATGVQR